MSLTDRQKCQRVLRFLGINPLYQKYAARVLQLDEKIERRIVARSERFRRLVALGVKVPRRKRCMNNDLLRKRFRTERQAFQRFGITQVIDPNLQPNDSEMKSLFFRNGEKSCSRYYPSERTLQLYELIVLNYGRFKKEGRFTSQGVEYDFDLRFEDFADELTNLLKSSNCSSNEEDTREVCAAWLKRQVFHRAMKMGDESQWILI